MSNKTIIFALLSLACLALTLRAVYMMLAPDPSVNLERYYSLGYITLVSTFVFGTMALFSVADDAKNQDK